MIAIPLHGHGLSQPVELARLIGPCVASDVEAWFSLMECDPWKNTIFHNKSCGKKGGWIMKRPWILCTWLYLLGIAGIMGASSPLSAATPREVDAAIQKGVQYLKQDVGRGGRGGERELGETALAGLALLECGVPRDDPALKGVTARIREAAFAETRTYHLALYILYLDRLGDPADVPIIQMLAIRLLAGQNAQGGWTYTCSHGTAEMEAQLRSALLTAELRSGDVRPLAEKAAPARPALPARDLSRLHPAVQRYARQLQAEFRRGAGQGDFGDDNSNTQFAILGLWAARKHGVPVEEALDLIQQRFLQTQCHNGGWPYSGRGVPGSPSMTCVGLLGLATAVGRRQERLLRNDPSPLTPPAKSAPPPPTAAGPKNPDKRLDDPFFQPPPELPNPKGVDPKGVDQSDPFFQPPLPEQKGEPPPQTPVQKPSTAKAPPGAEGKRKAPFAGDPCAPAIQRGLENLAAVLQGNLPGGKGKRIRDILGGRDYYFLWSLERVGVIYGLEKIGPVDWYQYGADILIPAQHPNGSWGNRVDTAFALLFLARSNVVRDLSRVVQGKTRDAELRSGGLPPFSPLPNGERPLGGENPTAVPETDKSVATGTAPPVPRPRTEEVGGTPGQTASSSGAMTPPLQLPPIPTPRPESKTSGAANSVPPADASPLVEELLRASEDQWILRLAAIRDGKGGVYTQALLIAIRRAGEDKAGAIRQALAERLTRMTAETLRQYLKGDDPELRRATVLAMAMKDDKTLIPDLITALLDEEEMVVRAARVGLKSLTGQDFGPLPGADLRARSAAAHAWLDWFRKQQR
jgi:hypothetical protein